MTVMNLTKSLKPQGVDKDTWYPGIVADNDDPEKLGRLRIKVDGIQDDVEDEMLPWAIPNFNHVDGATPKESSDSNSDTGSNESGSSGSSSSSSKAAAIRSQQTNNSEMRSGGFSSAAGVSSEGASNASSAVTGGTTEKQKTSGTFMVPKIGTKVSVKFQDGDLYHPMWSGYTIDETTLLKEIEENYPDRAVLKFQNGSYIVVDTKTNEIFLNAPGDFHLTVLGNMNQVVVGDSQEIVSNAKSDIPSYLAATTSLADYDPSPKNGVKFKGLGKKGGSKHLTVKGDYTMEIQGDRIVRVYGSDTLEVKGNRNITVMGNETTKIGGTWIVSVRASGTLTVRGALVVTGATIDLN